MTIRFFSFICFYSLMQLVSGQNLVPNPSFEEHNIECVPLYGVQNWYNPNLGTPDYCTTDENQCGIYLSDEFLEDHMIMPPSSGQSMFGIFCMATENTQQSREYLSTQLLVPMIQGENYNVSLKVSRSIDFNYAINNLGIAFTIDSLYEDTPLYLSVEPQLVTNEFLIDNSTWQSLTFVYTASGNEQFVTIGCFSDYNSENVINTGTSLKNWDHAYYYIDEVVVEHLTMNTVEASPQEDFIMYGSILRINNSKWRYANIYNLNGALLKRIDLYNEKELSLVNFPKSLYILNLQNDVEQVSYKVIN